MGTGNPTVGRIEPEGAKAIEDKADAANQVSGTGYMDQGVQVTNRGEAQLHAARTFLGRHKIGGNQLQAHERRGPSKREEVLVRSELQLELSF